MWTPAQITVMQSVYDALGDIQRTFCPRDDEPAPDFVEPSLLSSMKVFVSDLPIVPRDQIDMEPRYLNPLSKAEMEDRFTTFFGPPGNERYWGGFAWPSMCLPDETRSDKTYASMYNHTLRLAFHKVRSLGDPDDDDGPGIDLLNDSGWVDANFRSSSFEERCLLWQPDIVPQQHDGADWVSKLPWTFGTRIPSKNPLDWKPHLQFTVEHAAPFNGLLTSELLGIATMMKRQIARPKLDQAGHRLFPVIAYTFNGPQVRITQAVYDNGGLQIRQSPGFTIHCEDDDFSPVKLLLSWMVGTPCGSTLWPGDEGHHPSENERPAEPLMPANPVSPKVALSVST